ncbi:hypothetical protein ACHAXH_006672 [Discostella pseudostelligera]
MADAIIDPAVLHQFDICHKVGQGAYGIVWKAISRKHGRTVALKKCFDAFRCDVDAQRTFREVMYLRALSCGNVNTGENQGHPNIVKLFNVIRADNDRDLYITFEYSETDLSHVIKARILEPVHIQFIIYQLLKALKFLHSAALLHRDIKPSNILVDSSCAIKLCDFGLCRSIAAEEQQKYMQENLVLTDYIATRWYRPPEVLVGSRRYNAGIDLWSVGCILGEMFRGGPLLPGASTLGQLEMIFEMTGNPHSKDVKSWQSPYAPAILAKVQAKRRVKLDELCKNLPRDAKHLMKDLFKLDPSKRGSAALALEHEYLATFHDPEKEITYPHGSIRIGINDNAKLTANEYRQKLYCGIDDNENHDNHPCRTAVAATTGMRAPSSPTSARTDTEDVDEELPDLPTVSYDSLEYHEI